MNHSKTKIRVLHLITRLIVGGAQENTMLTADFLDKDRYEVEVWSGAQFGVEGSLQLEYDKRGIKVEFIPELVRNINPIKDIYVFFKLVRNLRRRPFDIIHTHSSKAGILGRLAAKLAGVPIIIHTVHGWSFHEHMSIKKRNFYIVLEKWIASFTDKLITVTELDTKKGLDAKIAMPEKYIMIHSGIEVEKYRDIKIDVPEKRHEIGISNNAIVVGNIGRLSEQKAPLDFVEMTAKVYQIFPQTRFIYVGDGSLRDAVERRIRELQLEKVFFLLGVRRDVAELIHCMDIFVLSSLWEGLPRVFPQSMAAGKPIVATKVDGASEAIHHGVNGFLVEPRDISGLTKYVNLLIENIKLRREMGEKGREIVDPAFNARNMVSQISKVYEELISNKKF